MIENYIYKKESNPNTFWYEDRKISLRKYQKDLLFYWSGEEDKAEYAIYDKSPICEVLPSIYNGGKFGNYSRISSPVSFDGRNFESLTDNLHISFWLGANCLNGYSTIFLEKNGDWDKLSEGDYSFTIQIDGEISNTIIIKLKEGSTFATLKNKLSFELDPNKYNVEVDLDQTTSSTIAVRCLIKGRTFKISAGNDGTDLLSILNQIEKTNGFLPSENIDIIKLEAEHSSFIISHVAVSEEDKTISKLKFTYSQGETTKITSIPWNNNGVDLDHIEVDIDSSVMYVFLNGELLKAVLISPIKRIAEITTLTLNGTENDFYSIEELIIKSKLQNKESFEVPTAQLTKYDTTRPYIDFYFSGNKIFANSLNSLIAKCSDNIDLVLNYGGLFYYYSAGAWRQSDGTYTKSNDSYTFADYINEFTFSGKDEMFIRAFFESDGDTPAWIEDLYFTLKDDSLLGDGSTTPAILVGEKEHNDEELQIKDKTLIIQTDQGKTEITFPDNLTIDEVIKFIKENYPIGIASIYKDNAGRLVLISETKGDNAYIIVSGNAAEDLFGKTKGAQGTDQIKNTIEDNYNKFIEDVKKYSSNDLIPIEIKDDQVRLYLQEALNIYKKYRSDDINTYSIQLKGNSEIGYEIPPIIEDWHDITDILFRPLFPIGFYTGAFDNDAEDVIALTLVNAMCGKGSTNYGEFYGKGFQTDYYISMMNIQAMERILGLDPTWKVLNNRLYIFPNNISKYLTVTICYKAPVDPIKAMRDPYIIQYVYGKIRMAQGEIRGQYGSNLSAGGGTGIAMQFNGDSMYERGKEAVEKAIEGMMKNQEPLGYIWG